MLGGVLVKKSNQDNFSSDIEKYFSKITGIRIEYKKLPRDNNGKVLPISGWKLGISHSEDYLAVAVLHGGKVGIDIEVLGHKDKLTQRVLSKILCVGEKKIEGSFLNNYVIKEAYSKFVGVGLSIGFSQYDAGKLLNDKKLIWKNYSTDDYICYLVHDIM